MTKVFLDLEETIIVSWHNPTLINVRAIKTWIDRMVVRPTTVNIFSFAIHNDTDRDVFVKHGIQRMIEEALELEVDEVLTVPEAMKIVTSWNGLHFDGVTDFIQVMGKHGAFEKVCLARESNCKCVLVDDAIPNRTILDHQRNLQIDLLPLQLLLDTSAKVDNRL